MSENVMQFGWYHSQAGGAGVFSLNTKLGEDGGSFLVQEGIAAFMEQMLKDSEYSSEESGAQYWEDIASSRRQMAMKLWHIVEGARHLMMEDGMEVVASYEAVVHDLRYQGGDVWEVTFLLSGGLHSQEVEIE